MGEHPVKSKKKRQRDLWLTAAGAYADMIEIKLYHILPFVADLCTKY